MEQGPSHVELISQWRRDEAAHFEGWDFSYLGTRYEAAVPPWDYVALARAEIARSSCLLDMQTGGGEVLASLAPFPGAAFASESYPPNIAIARSRLAPFGVEVRGRAESERLPFHDDCFDLVLNRHGGLCLGEVRRVLKPGGVLLTQQVSGDALAELQARFGAKPKWPDSTLANARANAPGAGLKIVSADEWNGEERFHDVGAIVYFLKAIPWLVDDFSVETHLEALAGLQRELESHGALTFFTSRYLIKAIKA